MTVRLKWGSTEYTGKLVSVDSYMNVQLSGAQEWQEGKSSGMLGQVLIRWVFVSRAKRRIADVTNGSY